jgi:hypothetical protein
MNSGRAPRLVAGVLVDDRVDRAADEMAAREGRQLMGDEDDIPRPPGIVEGGDDAAVAGADIVHADDVRVLLQQPFCQRLDARVVVAPLADRQEGEVGKIAADHLLEADLPFDMIADRDRAGDQADLAGPAGADAAEKGRGGAAGGRVVDADIVGAPRARRIGDERHHGRAGARQIVDRLAHRGVLEGDDRRAVDLAVQAVDRRGEDIAVEDVDIGDADMDPSIVEHALAVAWTSFSNARMKALLPSNGRG